MSAGIRSVATAFAALALGSAGLSGCSTWNNMSRTGQGAVIGAGSGIGKATAHRVAREGAHVVCADLSEEAARDLSDRAGLTKHLRGIDFVYVTTPLPRPAPAPKSTSASCPGPISGKRG